MALHGRIPSKSTVRNHLSPKSLSVGGPPPILKPWRQPAGERIAEQNKSYHDTRGFDVLMSQVLYCA